MVSSGGLLTRHGCRRKPFAQKQNPEVQPDIFAAGLSPVTIFMSFLAMYLLLGKAQVCLGEDNYSLLGPVGPVSGSIGSSVTLHVHLSPPTSAVWLGVHWYKQLNGTKKTVLIYQSMEQLIDILYSGRASLAGNLTEGDVSVKLDNLTVRDSGVYNCVVQGQRWSTIFIVTLTVKAIGSNPLMSVGDAKENGQVTVTCRSEGWYPVPIVNWSDSTGKHNERSRDVFTTGKNDLVNVSSLLLVYPSVSEWVTCSVGLSDQERRESKLILPTADPITIIVTSIICASLIISVILVILCQTGIIQCPHFLRVIRVTGYW